MLIILHVLIAIVSVLAATILLFKPKSTLINFNKFAIIATLISGTVLVLETKSGLIRACLTGLVYLAFAAGATYYSSKRINNSSL